MQWLTVNVALAAARRVLPIVLGAVLALLADAGLLDGALVEALQLVLSGSS